MLSSIGANRPGCAVLSVIVTAAMRVESKYLASAGRVERLAQACCDRARIFKMRLQVEVGEEEEEWPSPGSRYSQPL
jgi:hypothetical protein